MASSSADCVLGGVRLISSASSMLAKIGPWHEGPGAVAGGGIFFDDVGAGDVGRHQVRRELDALEHQAERLRHGADQQRLRGAGQTGDQAVAADKQRDQHLLEHLSWPTITRRTCAHDLRLHLLEAVNAAASERRVLTVVSQ